MDKIHHLNIHLGEEHLTLVPTVNMPLKLKLSPLKKNFIEIPLVRGATLSGQVQAYRFNEATTQYRFDFHQDNQSHHWVKTEQDLANILITLESDTEIHRRLTDKQGRFQVNGLRPGHWLIQASSETLDPDQQEFEKEHYHLELLSGERQELLIKIIPKIRQIQMLESIEELILE